uniref:ATP synthase subunit a n=2 Tax=Girardia TaxID=52316 RepID=A0A0C4ZJY9_9PLAT|nr:ATP synthase F0 subunit 6 [Girardia sp. ER-2015]QWT28937.1 ATP synthase F0 subunit 6 [Girardia tigrina]
MSFNYMSCCLIYNPNFYYLLFFFFLLYVAYYSYPSFLNSVTSSLFSYFGILTNFEYLNLFTSVFLLFGFIFFLNFSSLFPFLFVLTSNLWFSFFFSLSVIVSLFLLNLYFDFTWYVIDYVPLGCPILLSPVLVIIDFVSLWIRVFTLAVRLVINLGAGSLVGHYLSGTVSYLGVYLAYFFVIVYVSYEVLVSFIQASVFSNLVAVYFVL